MVARIGLIACLAFGLGACAPVPMVAITQNGHAFRGTIGGYPASFRISDGSVTCSGTFPGVIPGDTHSYTLAVICNNSLTGIAIFTDVNNLRSGGGGILRLSNGVEGTFITGPGAAVL